MKQNKDKSLKKEKELKNQPEEDKDSTTPSESPSDDITEPETIQKEQSKQSQKAPPRTISHPELTDDQEDEFPEDGKKRRKKKNKVVVINVPKKRKALSTPTQIIRIVMVLMCVVTLFLVSYPFLYAKLSINENLEVVPDIAGTYTHLATQEEIDQAYTKLSEAKANLVEAPKEEASHEEASAEDSQTSDSSDSSTANTSEAVSEPTYDPDNDIAPVRAISTANYEWQYSVADDVDIQKLAELIEEVREIERGDYTEESLENLNTTLLEAQRLLCATVVVSQTGLQMMLGGSVSEAFGNYASVGESILHGILAFLFAIVPLVGFFAATFDKKRHIKHVIILAGSVICLVDIFLTIYPYIGIGAVLSVIMYILIILLNFGSIYATQQERYILAHPEEEASFTEKHPQFVKALINAKTFGSLKKPTAAEQDLQSAKNAQKHKNPKKKKKK